MTPVELAAKIKELIVAADVPSEVRMEALGRCFVFYGITTGMSCDLICEGVRTTYEAISKSAAALMANRFSDCTFINTLGMNRCFGDNNHVFAVGDPGTKCQCGQVVLDANGQASVARLN